jgi:predicted MFS family arabinose efflux permease
MTVSAAGDSASWIALVALSLRTGHASLPVLVALYTAPVAVGGLGAGWALDRFNRRRLMIADNVVRSAVFASIPLVAVIAQPGPVQFYAVAGLYGLLKMISLAGFPSLIPSLVPAAQLDQANALEGASYGLASLVGAALAGLAIATIGPVPVVALDAASYLILAASLLSVRGLNLPAPLPRQRRGGAAGATSLATVVRLAATSPVLRATTIMFALFNIGEGTLLVFLPHRALGLGLGPGGYGYLVTATTGGELAAAALLARRRWRAPLLASIITAQLTAALIVLMLILRSTATTLFALAVLGACSAPMTAWAQTLRMRLISPEAHGRMFALLRTAMQATPPLGAGLAALTMAGGTLATIFATAAVMGLPAALLAASLLISRATAADRCAGIEQPSTATPSDGR